MKNKSTSGEDKEDFTEQMTQALPGWVEVGHQIKTETVTLEYQALFWESYTE